jgi:putative MATE family efflux protein
MKAFNNLIDLFLVSNMLAPEYVDDAISAISIPGPVLDIAHAIAAGFMTAGAALIAQYLGAKRKDGARKVTGQLLLLCTIAGVIMNAALYFATPAIMRIMGAEGQALQFMIDYVQYRSFEMVPLFLFYAYQASRTASGDTITPFLLNVVMIVFNVVSSWALIKYFNMGVKGAALGTTLANVVIVPIFLYMMFHKNEKNIYVTAKDIVPDMHELYGIFKISWPIAISQSITSLGFLLLNGIIYSYGQNTVNAFQVGNRLNSMVLMPAMGIGSISATFVGQNIGANNEKRARESVRTAMIMSVAFAIVGCFTMLPLRSALIGIFLKGNPEALTLSVEYMFFILTGLPLMSIFQVYMGAYQGSGETKFSLIMAVIRLWLMRIPMVYFFKEVLLLPNSTIWYTMIFSNFGAAYIGIILYTMCKFKPRVKTVAAELEEVI